MCFNCTHHGYVGCTCLWCSKKQSIIKSIPKTCRYHTVIGKQQQLGSRGNNLVKLDDLPEEQGRIDLEQLHQFMEAHGNEVPFIAVTEKLQDATAEKTGGLNITLWTGANYKSRWDFENKIELDEPTVLEEGLYVTQKYSKISGRKLKESMESMGLNDTEQLGKGFFNYRLRTQRTGYARLIPVSKSNKKAEQPPQKE